MRYSLEPHFLLPVSPASTPDVSRAHDMFQQSFKHPGLLQIVDQLLVLTFALLQKIFLVQHFLQRHIRTIQQGVERRRRSEAEPVTWRKIRIDQM